jgi:hypothetical protein
MFCRRLISVLLLCVCTAYALFPDLSLGKQNASPKTLPKESPGSSTISSLDAFNFPGCERGSTPPAVAALVQIGQNRNIDLIVSCITNIAAARALFSFSLDILITFVDSYDPEEERKLLARLTALPGVNANAIYHQRHRNAGFDVAPFMKQLRHTIKIGKKYDFVFKVHSKSNTEWLKYSVDCLCGSQLHVVSILRDFVCNPAPTAMIAAQGTVFGSMSDRSQVSDCCLLCYAMLLYCYIAVMHMLYYVMLM